MFRSLAVLAIVALAGCAPTPIGPPGGPTTLAEMSEALPPMRRFAGRPGLSIPAQPNGQLARDFLALSFQLETGRTLETFTRYEGPITVGLENATGGPLPATLQPDLTDLLGRLRREAAIDVQPAAEGEMASLTISVVPRATLEKVVPGAACFVVPRVTGWSDYLNRRFGAETDWTTLRTRSRASVFLPGDVSPQEVRDCLHEEVAQALGPLNDLYRLPHSVFNDDNTHVVLTDFDMLLLRATYHPALRSGMTRAEVAARLPAILSDINPSGRLPDRATTPDSPVAWTEALRGALDSRGSDQARLSHAESAVQIARTAGWTDERLAFSELTLGRAALPLDGQTAVQAFATSSKRYAAHSGSELQRAIIAVQLGAFAVSSGDPESALSLLDDAIPAADGAQNASLLATLLLLRAEATALSGHSAQASRIRREGLAWGRYAWGDEVLAIRAAEVASLRPGA